MWPTASRREAEAAHLPHAHWAAARAHWSQADVLWHQPHSSRCPLCDGCWWQPSPGSLLFSSLPFQEVFASQLNFETEDLWLSISSHAQNQSGVTSPWCSCPGRCRLMASSCFDGGQHQHGGTPGTLACCSWVTKLKQQEELLNRMGECLPPTQGLCTHLHSSGWWHALTAHWVTSRPKPSRPKTQLELPSLTTLSQGL